MIEVCSDEIHSGYPFVNLSGLAENVNRVFNLAEVGPSSGANQTGSSGQAVL